MMKFSARPVKNLVNLCAKIRSISSACLILMLMRMELMEGSIRTCSFSLRAMCMGFSTISVDVLRVSLPILGGKRYTWLLLQGRCVVLQLGWRSSPDIEQQSDSPEHSLDMVVVYSTNT